MEKLGGKSGETTSFRITCVLVCMCTNELLKLFLNRNIFKAGSHSSSKVSCQTLDAL